MLLVLLTHHAERLRVNEGFDRWMRNNPFGWPGLDIFFVLSGFLITGILVDSRGRPNYFRNFYARRTLRVFPLYYGVLILLFFVLPLVGIDHWVPPTGTQWWYWSYLSNWWIYDNWQYVPDGIGVFWSLAVEEQFYLVWPLVILLTPRHRLRAVIVTLIVGFMAVRIGAVVSGVATKGAIYAYTITRADAILIGAWLAVYLRDTPRSAAVMARATRVALVATIGIMLVVLVQRGNLHPFDPRMQIFGYSLVSLLNGAVLVLAITLPKEHLLIRILESRLLVFFGVYSYAMYILHVVVLVGLKDALSNTSPYLPENMIVFVALPVTICLAVLSWHLYEKHFLALKRHFA